MGQVLGSAVLDLSPSGAPAPFQSGSFRTKQVGSGSMCGRRGSSRLVTRFVDIRRERKTGIAPFDRLVQQVVGRDPYRRARRVDWLVDSGCSQRGLASVGRPRGLSSNPALVHGPVHVSWLHQIQIYLSVVRR